jgi:predicted permease
MSLRAGWTSDLRQTWRGLSASPRHVLTVVLCLGVGLTVSVAVFSIVNSLLYGDIPGIADRRSLLRVFISHEQAYGRESIGRAGAVSASPLSRSDLAIVEAVRDENVVGWAAEGDLGFAVSFRGASVGTTGVFVSRDYFSTIGTPPFLGRLLTPADHAAGAPPAAVIGFHLWRDRFGAAPDVVGQPLLVGGRMYTIAGVTPPRFTGFQPADVGASPLDYAQLWLPMSHAATWPGAPSESAAWLTVRARLAAGRVAADARPALDAAARRVSAASPNDRKSAAIVLSSYGFGPNDSPLDVLILIGLFLAVPLSVLAIACANVANLQLARATERARELAVRLAIGATRGQIIRLLSIESFGLAVLASIAGWAGAAAVLRLAAPMFPLELSLDWHVLVFALVLTAGVTMLSGLAPAWLVARRAAAAGLQQSDRAGGLAHKRLRSALVVAQIAASLVLLVMAGMFTQSVRAMRASAPPELASQLVVPFELDMLNYSPADATTFLTDFTARLAADGRIQAVAAEQMTGFRYREAGAPATERGYSAGGYITPSWLDVTSARLLAGRAFRADDGRDVAIVSERMARQLDQLGQLSVVGRTLEVSTSADAPSRTVTVVGIIGNRQLRPEDINPDAALYLPFPSTAPTSFLVRVRTGDPTTMGEAVRQVMRNIDPRLPWERVEPAVLGYLRDLGPIRYLALSIGGFGFLAALLAAAGLFAVTAYVVSLRTREIGIRVAIGANRRDVLRLVLGQGLRLGVAGSFVGVALAVPLAVALRAALVGVFPIDPVAFVPPVVLMLIVALAASAIPARRAATIDPVRALRQD